MLVLLFLLDCLDTERLFAIQFIVPVASCWQ